MEKKANRIVKTKKVNSNRWTKHQLMKPKKAVKRRNGISTGTLTRLTGEELETEDTQGKDSIQFR